MDPDWIRWMVASLTKHFGDALASSGLYLQVEGTGRRTDKLQDYAELRHDGPRFVELSRGYWQADVDVDVLVVSKVNDANIYAPEADLGAVLAAFTNEVPAFRYGTGPRDDPSLLLGCFTLVPANGGIAVTNFGLNREQVRLRQASVEATYRMYIST